MKRIPGLLVPLVLVTGFLHAEEEPEAPSSLPASLRPGASAEFDQSPTDGKLRCRVAFRVEAGGEGKVVLVRESATADLGPLTLRDRLRAILDVASRRFLSFTYEVAGAEGRPFRLLYRLGPDPDRPDRFLHERFRYPEKGEPKISRRRLKLEGFWVPDLLEPFAVGILASESEGGAPLRPAILKLATGRISGSIPEYSPLGEGEMSLGGRKVPCRIFRWKRGDGMATVYYRTEDLMPVRHSAAGLTMRPRPVDEEKTPR